MPIDYSKPGFAATGAPEGAPTVHPRQFGAGTPDVGGGPAKPAGTLPPTAASFGAGFHPPIIGRPARPAPPGPTRPTAGAQGSEQNLRQAMFHRVDTMDDSDNGIASSSFGRGESNQAPAPVNRSPQFSASEPPLQPRQPWGHTRMGAHWVRALKGDFGAVIDTARGLPGDRDYQEARRRQIFAGGEQTNKNREQIFNQREELFPFRVGSAKAGQERAQAVADTAKAASPYRVEAAAHQARASGHQAEAAESRAAAASLGVDLAGERIKGQQLRNKGVKIINRGRKAKNERDATKGAKQSPQAARLNAAKQFLGGP